jgi:hypothetical protein
MALMFTGIVSVTGIGEVRAPEGVEEIVGATLAVALQVGDVTFPICAGTTVYEGLYPSEMMYP